LPVRSWSNRIFFDRDGLKESKLLVPNRQNLAVRHRGPLETCRLSADGKSRTAASRLPNPAHPMGFPGRKGPRQCFRAATSLRACPIMPGPSGPQCAALVRCHRKTMQKTKGPTRSVTMGPTARSLSTRAIRNPRMIQKIEDSSGKELRTRTPKTPRIKILATRNPKIHQTTDMQSLSQRKTHDPYRSRGRGRLFWSFSAGSRSGSSLQVKTPNTNACSPKQTPCAAN